MILNCRPKSNLFLPSRLYPLPSPTSHPSKLTPSSPTPATEIEESPHRVCLNLGADRPQTRFKRVFLMNLYLFGKDRGKGGLRTAIEVCPVRVWVKRGAETPQSRLRGDRGVNRVWSVSASRFGQTRGGGRGNAVAGWAVEGTACRLEGGVIYYYLHLSTSYRSYPR